MKIGDVWGLCCTDAFGMVGLLLIYSDHLDADQDIGHGSSQCLNCSPVEGYV